MADDDATNYGPPDDDTPNDYGPRGHTPDDDDNGDYDNGDYDNGDHTPDDDDNEPPPDPGSPRVSATERAQTELILRSVPEARAFPPWWRDSPEGVQYLFRSGSVVVRDWHLERVLAVLRELVRLDDGGIVDVVAGATRITWAGDDADDPDGRFSVPAVLRVLDRRLGPGFAAPDTLVYVCGHSCAATEPEVVAPDAVPIPRPQIGQDAADPGCGDGRGVRVLVMDTGLVAHAATDHSWLAGVTGELDDPVNPTTGRLAQDGGHGTFTAGCVRVLAPAADVHVVNATAQLPVEPDAAPIGAAFETDLARLVRDQLIGPEGAPITVPDVLVLNFAGTSRNGGPLLAFDALYDDVIQHLKELLILSPAGNEGDTRKNWPGSYSWVVSVGALDAGWRNRAPWSNFGHNVDVYLPGDELVNAFATGTYECTWEGVRGELRKFRGMARWSGTSFATPLAAGLIAARMSSTGQSSRRAWHSLLDRAERQARPGVGPVLYPGQACDGGC